MPRTRRFIAWGGIAFIVFFVAFRPDAALDVVKTLGAVVIDILTGVGDFFSRLVTAFA